MIFYGIKFLTSYQRLSLIHQYSLFLQQRREQDEFKIADLKNTMMRLDSELIIEIKRRTEMNKSTQMVGVSYFSHKKLCYDVRPL
jgi:hypothetical protein